MAVPLTIAAAQAGVSGMSGWFTVSFTSSSAGNGMVFFGSGPGCTGLVEVATGDQHLGTTSHTVTVTGNDLPGSVGDVGVQPGVTYWYELVTGTSSGMQIDNNGGKCYSVTIPTSAGMAPSSAAAASSSSSATSSSSGSANPYP
jgi:hypothetical protein